MTSVQEPVAVSPNDYPTTTTTQSPMTLPELVKKIHEVLGPDGGLDSANIDVGEIIRLMEEYSSQASDWEQYAIFDHSRAYTRNLVDDGNGKFNLMILAWSKGQHSPIHDHAGSHCVMKILDGTLCETQYAWPSDDVGDTVSLSVRDITEAPDTPSCVATSTSPLHITKSSLYNANKVAYIHDKIGLHRITNPSTERGAVSLHLYTPPYQACKTFEEHTGRSRSSGKCTFYSIRGKKCSEQ